MTGALRVRTSTSPDVWTTIGGGSFATDAETVAGVLDDRAVTPAGLNAALDEAEESLPFTVIAPSDGDDTAAINAAIATVAPGGTLYFHEGTYQTTGPITSGNVNVIMPMGAEIVYTGTGTAWTVAPPTISDCLDVTLRVRRSAIEWDTGVDTTSTGVVIVNNNFSRYKIHVANFKDGLVLRGNNTGTCYNVVDLINVQDNKRNLVFDIVGTGWVNSNEFRGRLRYNSGRSSYVGTRMIDMSTGGNGNTFVGVTMEGGSQERTWVIASSNNVFLNCRLEGVAAGSCEFTSTAAQNWVIGGYGNDNATTMFVNPSGHNTILGNYGGKRYVDAANGNPKGDEHRTNGYNVIAETYTAETVGVETIYGDITGGGTLSLYNNKGTDATPLVQIAGVGAGGRGIWFSYSGAGTAGASGRIYGHNAGNIGVVGNLVWGTDNLTDIGFPGALRPRDIHLARNLRIGGALDHDGTTVGFYNTTPIVKPTVSAAATDPATTMTLVNSLRTALIALGLVA